MVVEEGAADERSVKIFSGGLVEQKRHVNSFISHVNQQLKGEISSPEKDQNRAIHSSGLLVRWKVKGKVEVQQPLVTMLLYSHDNFGQR